MTLDHFRPKSLADYAHLRNDPLNLLYSCDPCNQLKGQDWPAYGTPSTVSGGCGYIDPFAVDRREYFVVNDDGSLTPKKDPAAYMMKILELDRQFLRTMRKKREVLFWSVQKLEQYFKTEIGACRELLRATKPADRLAIQYELERLRNMQAIIRQLDELWQLA